MKETFLKSNVRYCYINLHNFFLHLSFTFPGSGYILNFNIINHGKNIFFWFSSINGQKNALLRVD